MILALVLCSIALAIQPAFSYPLGMYADTAQGFDLATDFDPPYFGPWNYGNRWWGAPRGLWPYDGYGYGDIFDYDYGYNYGNPVRTIDVGRDRVVRDFAVTETDNWVRDQTTFRAPPRVRYGAPYGTPYGAPYGTPYGAPYGTPYGPWPARRAFASGVGGPRTSSLRTGGDMMFMRR